MMPNKPYKPDRRLASAYAEATELGEAGLLGLCPSYIELSEADTRYQDHELLGKGAVKEVYKTFNNHTRRWIAMARLRADRGPEFYDQFVHEAWLTASLSHPNIITVHDAGVDADGRPFFTMDLKGQSNLAGRVRDGGPAERRELLEIFMKVCDAVGYAHSRGVIHLDLKPENIQADEYGEVLVCDWGLAKLADETEEGEDELPEALQPMDNMTLVGQIKGSPGYMAPEQVVPGAVKDHRSDIFSLGCILHLILTGHAPFEGADEDILRATRDADLVAPRKKYPESHMPAALEAVVMKALSLHPDDRYDSVKTLKSEISNFLEGYSTLAEKPGFFREARLFVGRNRLPVTMLVGSIVAFSVFGVLAVQNIRRQRALAVRFEAKAETVENLYQDELERSEQERLELARKLASSASDLKKLGIFVRPVETVREARKLVASAFALDPDCATARLQHFSLNCITLNFEDALKAPVLAQSGLADYMLFAEAFPHYNFTEERRPGLGQLQRFLERGREVNPNRKALMERIVAYDHAARADAGGYTPVVKALVDYVNAPGAGGSFVLEEESGTSTLKLKSTGTFRLAIWDSWGSNLCLLRFLKFRTLQAEVDGRFFTGDLDGLQIETLDISRCTNLAINHAVNLPLLRRVIIRPGQITSAELRSAIHSNDRFEIVER
ncbi:serine/threonine-protein kinase [Pontiella sp.]|uniref:serine/threonine-protein kinase n=1 Tax=Pontiella sp. TaxID=2837462 RepID=UPI0035625E89